MWLSEENLRKYMCLWLWSIVGCLICISITVKWCWKKSQKYQLQCPPVNLEGCFSLGVNCVGSFSKDVNLEPSSKAKQYHLHSASEEAGITISWDSSYFSIEKGWGIGKVRKTVGRNQEAEMWTKWGEVLRKRNVSLIIIVHINFSLSCFICTTACKCENNYLSHFIEAN